MSEAKVVQLRRGDAYAGMPGGRKGKNLAPTKDQFRELQRLLALFRVVSDALGDRIGHHLPVSLLDRLTHFTHRKTMAFIRSKLDDWACQVERGGSATAVFYSSERAELSAKKLVDQFLADGTESLPDGFMDKTE